MGNRHAIQETVKHLPFDVHARMYQFCTDVMNIRDEYRGSDFDVMVLCWLCGYREGGGQFMSPQEQRKP